MEKGEYQKAEIYFKKALEIKDLPNAYYGLTLLYRVAGQLEAGRSVLETFLNRSPPIFHHLLQNPDAQGITAIVVYPMNALINSQMEEFNRYKVNYENASGNLFSRLPLENIQDKMMKPPLQSV